MTFPYIVKQHGDSSLDIITLKRLQFPANKSFQLPFMPSYWYSWRLHQKARSLTQESCA